MSNRLILVKHSKVIILLFFNNCLEGCEYVIDNRTMHLKAQSQIEIDTASFCYFNGITAQTQIIDNYQITNNSNEEYLTWVSLLPTNNKSNIELIHDFFKKRKGDFSLMEMINENMLDEQPISIGFSFIKDIAAGETFSYFIAKTDINSTLYQDRIAVVRRKEVEKYLKIQIEKKYFFRLTSIFLIEN